MTVYDSKTWISDIDRVMETLPELGSLAGKSVLITGASGLICSAVVDILQRYNDTHEKKIVILAAGRSRERMEERFPAMGKRPEFQFIPYDAAKPDNAIGKEIEKTAGKKADYVIHGASNATPGRIISEPVETMLSNILGMKELLELARESGTERLLYISSSEVYGEKNTEKPFKEDEYGAVNLLSPRSSYPIGKSAAETLCVSYGAEYGVDSVIVRPGHIYGPTATRQDNRVGSAWLYSAARGEDIVMKSDGSQLRSYVYCLDNASAILKVLLRGESLHAYNISNPDSIITIRQMGELAAKAGNVALRMDVPSEEEKKSFNSMQNSSLEAAGLLGLGWQGYFSADEGIDHTVRILKEVLCLKN